MGDAHVYSLRYVYDIPKIMPNLIFCIYHLLTEPLFPSKILKTFKELFTVKWRRDGVRAIWFLNRCALYSTIGHVRVMCSVFIPVIWGMEAVGGWGAGMIVSIIKTTWTDGGVVSPRNSSPKQNTIDTLKISTFPIRSRFFSDHLLSTFPG